jgi:hypothetical protein
MRNVGRNTTYVCENVTFNEAKSISVQTRVAIPGYIHDRIAVTQINGIYKKILFFWFFIYLKIYFS